MKKTFSALAVIISALVCCSCAGRGAADSLSADNLINYENTDWGMTAEQVTAARGEPDRRTDLDLVSEKIGGGDGDNNGDNDGGFAVTVPFNDEAGENGEEQGEENETPEYLDFYYYDKPLLDKFTGEEKFLFDEEQLLWGVICRIEAEGLPQALKNTDEKLAVKNAFLDLRETFNEKYGEPAEEYTAYDDGNGYETDKLLDLERENAVIFASRWDGNDYRFLYLIHYAQNEEIEVRYVPHTKEEVEAYNADSAAK